MAYVDNLVWDCAKESLPCNTDQDCSTKRCNGGDAENRKQWKCFDYGAGIKRCAEKATVQTIKKCDPINEMTMFRMKRGGQGELEYFCAPTNPITSSAYFLPRGSTTVTNGAGGGTSKRCIDTNDVLRIEMPHNNAHSPVYYFTCFPTLPRPSPQQQQPGQGLRARGARYSSYSSPTSHRRRRRTRHGLPAVGPTHGTHSTLLQHFPNALNKEY